MKKMKKRGHRCAGRFARYFRGLVLPALLYLAAGCATGTKPSDSVLEPVPTPSPTVTPIAETRPRLVSLQKLLQSRGIIGVGLEHETDAFLEVAERSLSDRRSIGRRIRFLYSGMALAYDSKTESLTIGGTSDLSAIERFISKIPLR